MTDVLLVCCGSGIHDDCYEEIFVIYILKQKEIHMYCKSVLPNGLRIVSEAIPYVKSVTLGIWVGTGSRFEQEYNHGISHFIEHMIFKGTHNRSAKDIAEAVDSVGGQLNAFTGKEYTCYYIKVLDTHLELAIDILSDMLLSSKFDGEDIKREREVVLEEIHMYEDTPDEIIYDLLFKGIWKNHPLAFPVTGECSSILPMTREDIINFVKDFYTPDNIIFSLAGNFDSDQVIEQIKSNFEHLNDDAKNYKLPSPELNPVVIVNEKDIEQAHLCIATRGINVDHMDRYPLSIIDIALSGGISSRLFQEVREKRGLAYTINSYKAMYRSTGIFGVYAGTSVNNIKEVINIVLNEFATVKENALTEEELTRAKKQLKGCMLLGLESMYYRSYRNVHSEFYFNKIYNVEEVCQIIDNISVQDIKRVADYIFTPEYYALSVIGPKNIPKEYSLYK